MLNALRLLLVFYLFLPLFACKSEDDGVPVITEPDPDPKTETEQYGEPFDKIPDTEDVVMYEVNLRALSPSGDIEGVIGHLDHIRSLGVNVIWLMPIHPIGDLRSVNSPYSVQDYKEVNPEFGTLEDLRELVEEAHDRDMAIILDWVANHTAWDNPWIANKNWYTQDANGNIIHPPGTNWQDVADLNYANDSMRLAMIEAMKYWVLRANVDGFRCDAADFVPFDFWEQAIDSLENIGNRGLILLAEGARKDHFEAGFQMNYAWDFYGALKAVYIGGAPAGSLFSTHEAEYHSLPDGKHKLRFITNHDESAWDATPVELFGGEQGSLSAFIIAAYLGGVPLIYGSQEVGVEENIPFFSNAPIDWTINPALFAAYQNVLSFYNESAALREGQLQTYPDPDILAFKKDRGEEEVLVLVNIRNGTKSFTLPSALENTSWEGAWSEEAVLISESLEFMPYEYRVLKR